VKKILLLAVILFGALASPSRAHAQDVDVIRGRITDPENKGIEGAVITATSLSGNVNRTTRTDTNGRFTITFPGGDGDYIVAIAALGYAARRFEVKRAADEQILLADAKLTRIGTVLDPLKITAERPKVSRSDAPPDISGTEKAISNNAGVPADMMGDLAAMAATLPGVQAVTGSDGSQDGYSVLGLGADQNNTTLNGLNFGGSSIPRDAQVRNSLITSPYDVSRGGFSGAQISLSTRSGSNFVTRGMSLNLDAPQLQWSDRASQALGQEYTNLSLGGALSGPVKYDKAFYNMSYQLGRRSNELHTLLSTNAAGFEAAGVSPDSVARLLTLLQARGIPFTTGTIPSNRLSDQGSLFGSIDVAPPSSNSGQAFNISFNGNWNKQNPTSGFATELPSHSGERTGWRGGLQGRHSGYLHNSFLTESTVGFSLSKNYSNPFLDMPQGVVRVNSDFPDGTSSVQALQFGGNTGLNTTQSTTSINALNQISWFSVNNKHRVRLTSEVRRDGNQQELWFNSLVSFAYNSLADFQANRPATISRQLGTRVRDIGQIVGAVSLGDAYRRTDRLQFQYGVRVDGSRFTSDPIFSPQVETLFGVRNDNVPNKIYVSPRIGFSWGYGTQPQVAGFEGAFRGPAAVVRGGIGIFQNIPQSGTIASAMDNTGLPSAVQQITCLGTAAPTPDWNSYATNSGSIPSTCADGTTGSVFANVTPNVSLFAPNYSSPKSVRSNLNWGGQVLDNRFAVQLDGTYSLNLNQSGTLDMNFAGLQRFALSSEGNRPMFVLPTSIVPTTGAIAAQDSRFTSAFARVSEQVSDLRSESKQATLRVSPTTFHPNYSWNVSYVYSNVREQVRGFNNTAGNPLLKEWARSSFDSRHQIVYNVGYNLFDYVRFNWYGSFRSGSPFTPMVAGDVNGDGYSNDRAFVFDPASAEPTVASAMKNLLDNGSTEAKDCLAKQVGRLSERNSCQAPWYSTANLSMTLNPIKWRMPQRATVSFSLSNPLGAADLLINGSDKLRGWGQPNFPDPSLLYVRGFDPATQKFRYEVNQRFGTTNRATSFRLPVTLTAMMRFDVGPFREKQLLTQQLDRGRSTEGTKAPEPMLRAIYNSGGLPNPLGTILRQQDSLRLTAPQADSVAMLNRIFSIKMDSIWTPIARDFAALPDNYDRHAVYMRYLEARRASVDELAKLGPSIKGLLTAEQRRKLPAFVTNYLEPRYLASIRNGTATFTGNPFFGGDFFSFGGGAVSIGGGGGEIRVIRQ
jgi:hypothetical protein